MTANRYDVQDWLAKGYLTDFGFQGRYASAKPAVVRAWLAGDIDTDEAIAAAYASRNVGLVLWAGQLIAARMIDPASIMKAISVA